MRLARQIGSAPYLLSRLLVVDAIVAYARGVRREPPAKPSDLRADGASA